VGLLVKSAFFGRRQHSKRLDLFIVTAMNITETYWIERPPQGIIIASDITVFPGGFTSKRLEADVQSNIMDDEIGQQTERSGPGAPVPAKTNGSTLFHCLDPLGNEITLDVETWDHIIKGHPEMAGWFDVLKLALEHPMLIQRGSPSTCYYYRLTGRAFRRCQDIYVSLVVTLPEGETVGRVKTAHLMKTVRSQEGKILWLQSKQS